MKEISLKALGKINLGLDVTGKRADGYHEVRMIMQTVQLFDQIELHRTDKPGIRLRANLKYIPSDEGNLAYRAAKLLLEEQGIRDGVSIRLRKVIPVAAGMAGGSSDAAAVLVGVNRLFELGLTKKQLMETGVKLGADVPYCVMRGTALAEGIGEKLTRLAPMPKCHVLLAKPGVHVSTKFVYTNLRLDTLESHPDIDGQAAAIRAGDLRRTAELMGNVLESVTIPAYPVIRQIKEEMISCGALGAMMSGSGPTVFGLFESREQAKEAYERLKKGRLAKQVYLTGIFNSGGSTND